MTTRTFRNVALAGVATVALLATAACGGNSNGGSGGSSSGSSQASSGWDQHGPITYVQGKDTSGYVQPTIDKWNAAHPNEKVTLMELSESADEQRQKMIDNANTKGSAGYDVLSVDVVWTAEFAANQYIVELPKDQFKTDGYLKSAVDSGTYFNKLYAFPTNSDGALLYYNKEYLDEAGVSQAPSTVDEMVAACQKVKAKHPDVNCFGGQFQKYEGLTCNFAEWINSAGANFLKDDGTPDVNSDAAVKGTEKLVSLFKDGTIPKDATTWKEETSRQAFQDGKLVFLRNWPYMYSLAAKTDGSSKVAGKFGVAPLPGISGPGVSTLGGHNMAITPYTKNKGTAKDFILWWNTQEQQKANLIASSQAPTIEALYTDPELTSKFPYLPTLQKSIQGAKPRPKAVKYGDVTQAIQNAAYAAINGQQDSKSALDDLQKKLTDLTKK